MHPRFVIPLLLLLGLTWIEAGCSRQPAQQGSPPTAEPTAQVAEDTSEGAGLLPRVGGVTGYASSDSCQECHPKQYDTWHRSYHRTMTQFPTPEAVQADFSHVVLTNAGARFILSRTNRQFWVHLESAAPGTPDRPAPEPVDVPLGLITGSHHMQVFWLGNGMGNCQIGFPFTWLIPERRWVPRNSTFLRPPTVELRPETWNLVCARCHATATQPGLDRAALAWRTQVEELGIACEACHGPAARHVALERQLKQQAQKTSKPEAGGRAAVSDRADRNMNRRGEDTAALPRIDSTPAKPLEPNGGERFLSPALSSAASGGEGARRARVEAPSATNRFIVHPEKISPARASQICGFCHSMKWWDDKEGWPERGFHFRPGDDLDATTPVMRPNHLDQQPWLKPALAKNPDLFRDFFWSDGMIRVSGRDYNGLIESPCYRGGQFSCLSCHTLHGGDPNGQLAENRKDNQACTQCHDRFRTETALTTHSRHDANSAGSLCYNCHMPRTTYGVLKAIRSHQVSSPKVADELATGRPNACNLCHLDKSLAWTRHQLAAWHPQPGRAALSQRAVVELNRGAVGDRRPTKDEGRGEGRARLAEARPVDSAIGANQDLSSDSTAVADSVRLALSGDAGQRVLMAWHFGWEPAWQASGKDWIPPVLAQLLDDPYAAVRCLAERSLRRLAPGLIPAGYDYAVSPETRSRASEAVFDQWLRNAAAGMARNLPPSTLVEPKNPTGTRQSFRRLISQRDDRPVRLRE